MTSSEPERGADSPEVDRAAARRGRQRDARRGLVAGVIAAVLGLAAMSLVRGWLTPVTAIEALADLVLEAMPIRLFSLMLRLFGTEAKVLLFLGLLGLLLLAGAWTGRDVARATAGSRRIRWERGVIVALSAWALLSVFLVWSVGIQTGGLAGSKLFLALGGVAVASAVFGVSLVVALALLRRTDPPPAREPQTQPADAGRRRLLAWSGLGLASLAGAAVLGRDALDVRSGEAFGDQVAGRMPQPITPTGRFYVISKNLLDPRGDGGDDWKLRVDGEVDTPLSLTLGDLQTMTGSDLVSTLTCISNPIGGPLISTARWSGVALAEVLEQAGMGEGVRKVVFHGRDGYTDAIPPDQALDPAVHLIWGMNGEPLNATHGAPLRAIVPGLYGIKNVKWLERISLTRDDHQGYWQRKGWTDTAVVKTSSQIRVPADAGIVAAGQAELGGLAFAGVRGISRVEVSADDGESWQEATITDRPSPLSWVLWRLPWTPAPGTYTVLVRATDGTGQVQTATSAPTLPDGASGWHEITVGVA